MECDDGEDSLVTQLNRVKKWNSQLNREKFDLEHRVRNLITQLGYRSLEDAEESQQVQSQAQAGSGPASESALQARLNKALAKVEVLENAATVSFNRHQRELDLLERDVRRLSGEKTALEQRVLLADSLSLDVTKEVQRMREEFDERLAIKEDIISELRSKMTLSLASPPEAPSRSQESRPQMEVDVPLPAYTDPDGPGVIRHLEFHHNELKKKYDVLLDEKRALARRFSNHIKQWKQFKVWYHTKYDAGDIDVAQLSASAKKRHYGRLQDTHDEQGRTLPVIVTDLIHSASADLSLSLPNAAATVSIGLVSSMAAVPMDDAPPDSPSFPSTSRALQTSDEPPSPIQPAMRSFDFDFDSLLPQPRAYPLNNRHPIEAPNDSAPRLTLTLPLETATDTLTGDSAEASPTIPQMNQAPLSLSGSSVERKNIPCSDVRVELLQRAPVRSSTPASSIPATTPAPRMPIAPLFSVFRSSTPRPSVFRPLVSTATLKTSTSVASPSDLIGDSEHKGDLHIHALKARLGYLSMGVSLTSLTPKTRSELPATLKRPRADEPISEPRAARRRRLSKPVSDDSSTEAVVDDSIETDTDGPAGRPSNPTIRKMKNDSSTRTGIERSHSSPPDTPHRASKIMSAREKVNSLRRENTSGEIGLGRDDSFARPSRPKALIMTKEEREAHFKQLRSKPHVEYKKEYAAYKGHGRYGQRPIGDEDEEDINAAYEIDKSRNDGMDRPFDEIVRSKEARQRLHGVDCPCCKAYYEAVGPVPPRLTAPLWKSPSPGQSQSQSPHTRRYRSASPVTPSKSRGKAIEDHRQQISRHRHNWIPPSTPPDYWTIGFPDTQQTKAINERAREIRAVKKMRIEEDASKTGGRYRKKR